VTNLVTIVSYARKIFITLSTKVYSCNFKVLNWLKVWSYIPNTSFSPLCKNGPNKPGLKILMELSTVDLLIRIAHFCKKVINVFYFKSR
jgi:hypothetical protein